MQKKAAREASPKEGEITRNEETENENMKVKSNQTYNILCSPEPWFASHGLCTPTWS